MIGIVLTPELIEIAILCRRVEFITECTYFSECILSKLLLGEKKVVLITNMRTLLLKHKIFMFGMIKKLQGKAILIISMKALLL